MEELRTKVKEAKNKYGISYKYMSEKTGISYSHIRNFMCGWSNLSPEFAQIMTNLINEYETVFRK